MEKTPSPLDLICDAFNIFHDGVIEQASINAGTLSFRMDIPYLANLVKPGYSFFSVELASFHDAMFEAWPANLQPEKVLVTDVHRIFSQDLEVLSAEANNDRVEVICNIHSHQDSPYCGGTLFFCADSIRVFDEGGIARSVDELGELCHKYWSDWKKGMA